MAVLTVDEGQMLYQPPPAALTTQTLTGPDRLQISDTSGVLATLTVGARTVAMRGPQRTFTENKRPFTDQFTRTSSSGFGTSPGGGNWSQSGTATLYTVTGSVGQISCDVANSSRHATIVDTLADVDVTAKVTVTT